MKKNNPYLPPNSNVEIKRENEYLLPRKIYIWSLFWRFYILFIALCSIISFLLPNFKNPMVIQYSTTFFLLFIAIIFYILGLFEKSGAIYLIKGNILKLNRELWKKVHYSNIFTIVFFAILNLVVSYFFNEEIWVNSKLIGYYFLMPIVILLTSSYFIVRYKKGNP